MTTYVSLLKFTDQGAKNLKQSPARAKSFCDYAEKEGIKVLGHFWTAGAHDGVLILQAENETKVLRCLAALGALGNVHTHSMRAFDAKEFAAIVD
jgi:uncharacterized protein with GYD domain